MTLITKEMVEAFRKDMDVAMKMVADKHGLSYTSPGATYYPDQGTLKIRAFEMGLKSVTKGVNPALIRDLARYGRNYGLNSTHLGKSFVDPKAGPVVVEGMKGRAQVIVRAADGKGYRYPVVTAAQMLGCYAGSFAAKNPQLV